MLHIHDITQKEAVFCKQNITVIISLDYTCERVIDDDHRNECFWDEYTPIIAGIQAFDENDNSMPVDDELTEQIKAFIDSEAFFTAYQSQFDDNFTIGRNTSRHYC